MDYSKYIVGPHYPSTMNSQGIPDDIDKFNEFIKKYNIKNYLRDSFGKYYILHFIYSVCNIHDSSYMFIDKDDNIIMTIHANSESLDSLAYCEFIEFSSNFKLKSEIISPFANYKQNRTMFLIHVPAKALELINFSCLNCINCSLEHHRHCLFRDRGVDINLSSFVCKNYRYNGFNKKEFRELFVSMI